MTVVEITTFSSTSWVTICLHDINVHKQTSSTRELLLDIECYSSTHRWDLPDSKTLGQFKFDHSPNLSSRVGFFLQKLNLSSLNTSTALPSLLVGLMLTVDTSYIIIMIPGKIKMISYSMMYRSPFLAFLGNPNLNTSKIYLGGT